jgi:hypothetical protein
VYSKTIRAYKLFSTKDGLLFPLYVDHRTPLPLNQWLKAEPGKRNANGKVISKIGPLAYRPGWHASEYPAAIHIGTDKDAKGRPRYRPAWHVWGLVELPDDVNWQDVADGRARRYRGTGEIVRSTAHITDVVPYGGHYRYKTNPNALGAWIISGNMKILSVLSDDEVKAINDAAGVADLPRVGE